MSCICSKTSRSEYESGFSRCEEGLVFAATVRMQEADSLRKDNENEKEKERLGPHWHQKIVQCYAERWEVCYVVVMEQKV